MSFETLGLSPGLLQAVEEAGYDQPTPIQEQAIPFVLAGRDVLGIAQTGTGKTASFTLPMIDRLSQGRARARMPRSLILEPTRELAAQVANSFETYGRNHKLSMALLIGGVAFGGQDRLLDRGVDVLVATPGRLLDQCQRGKVMLNGVQILVIDEADRMLDMGFIPDIEQVCRLIPFTRQTLLFSATMPPEIQRLTETFLQAPERVEATPPATAAGTVVQAMVVCSPDDKRDVLRRLIRSEKVKNGIVFCNRKREVAVLHRSLLQHGFDAAALHGDMDQHQRTRTLESFRNGGVMLLVASDVAARGLDIPDVSHVFNFDVPTHAENYIHRIGRTGRAGREGHAFMIATSRDGKYVQAIEEMLGTKITVDDQSGGASVAEDSDEPRRNDRGRRGRSSRDSGRDSGRSRSPRRESRSSRESGRESPPESERESRGESGRESRGESRGESGRGSGGESGRGRRRGGRRGSRESADADDAVVGMGSHMPDFLKTPAPRNDG